MNDPLIEAIDLLETRASYKVEVEVFANGIEDAAWQAHSLWTTLSSLPYVTVTDPDGEAWTFDMDKLSVPDDADDDPDVTAALKGGWDANYPPEDV